MKILVSLRSLAATVFHRSRLERDMDEELRAHIANRADDLQRTGNLHLFVWSAACPEHSRRAARRRFAFVAQSFALSAKFGGFSRVLWARGAACLS